jgi:hypothetical protein
MKMVVNGESGGISEAVNWQEEEIFIYRFQKNILLKIRFYNLA